MLYWYYLRGTQTIEHCRNCKLLSRVLFAAKPALYYSLKNAFAMVLSMEYLHYERALRLLTAFVEGGR